jgi:hypothetical protein
MDCNLFCILILVHGVCKTIKHFCMSIVGSFDPPYQGPQQVDGDAFRRAIRAPTSAG